MGRSALVGAHQSHRDGATGVAHLVVIELHAGGVGVGHHQIHSTISVVIQPGEGSAIRGGIQPADERPVLVLKFAVLPGLDKEPVALVTGEGRALLDPLPDTAPGIVATVRFSTAHDRAPEVWSGVVLLCDLLGGRVVAVEDEEVLIAVVVDVSKLTAP